jgi:hypothetical protein
MDGNLRERKEVPRFIGAGLDKWAQEKGMETDG